ncbi:HNH endonuclease [Chloroflexia bacterium SDU3-3]|nr:HNH endonuclease [Chloroflexia bacterium SDU3-3]
MRPINKGAAPRVYREYGDAQLDLISTIGKFCSYCERRITTSIAVEHKKPKDPYPQFRLDWANFLLACPNCNSTKSDQKIKLSRYFWPDTDNTFCVFEYTPEGFVKPRRSLPRWARRKARRTLALFGLDRYPNHRHRPHRSTNKDSRWNDRRNQWEKAISMRDTLAELDTPRMRECIIINARDGNFSIWMEVFKDDIDMCQRLIAAFPGTASDCFDAHGRSFPYPGR